MRRTSYRIQRLRRAAGVTIYTPVDSYQVIMELAPQARQGESAFGNIHVRSSTGALVPLSSFATVERTVGPTSVNHVGQLQAVTVSFGPAPGVALGDATARIEQYREQVGLPSSVITRYGGEAAVFKSSQGSQMVLIVAALLVIYVPIAMGIGAGAELRQPLDPAVVGGLLFSQVVTLYITPVIYLYLDRFSGKGPVTMRERAPV